MTDELEDDIEAWICSLASDDEIGKELYDYELAEGEGEQDGEPALDVLPE